MRIKAYNGGYFEIDECDNEFVSKKKWRINKGKVATPGVSTWYSLHRLLLNPPKGMVVDHIDGNPLNNKRSNLRICTQAENSRNQRRKKTNNKSRYKGVSKVNKSDKWRAYIVLSNKQKHLGMFNSENEAARAYNRAAFELHGKYCHFNKIDKEDRVVEAKKTRLNKFDVLYIRDFKRRKVLSRKEIGCLFNIRAEHVDVICGYRQWKNVP